MKEQTEKEVRLDVSEPWELGERSFTGRVVSSQAEPNERLLIALRTPFEHSGITYFSLLVSARHEGHKLSRINAGEAVPCNALGLVGINVGRSDPMEAASIEAASWRGGGLVLIGSLSDA